MENDFYATPPHAVELLLKHCDLSNSNSILEPACGDGAISKVLENHYPTAKIVSSDLVNRGYGESNVDFLSTNFDNFDVVITNPPFKLLQPFIEKALTIANKKVIMLARLQFLETEQRAQFFKDTNLSYVYIHSKRITPLRNGTDRDENGKKWSSTLCFAWFVWDKEATNEEPIIKFLTN